MIGEDRSAIVNPWFDLQSHRYCSLTSDQDWAPEWALSDLLDFAADLALPLHVFRTSPSAVLDYAVRCGQITQGWHPNFRADSSHGATPTEVVRTLHGMFGPTAYARTHEFVESSSAINALAAAGVLFLSQVPTMCEPWIAPIRHYSGIVYLPVFWEDDVWLGRFGTASPANERYAIEAPGVKIINIHAAHVGMNTPSMAHYDRERSVLFDPSMTGPQLRHEGRGTRELVRELVAALRAANATITSFPALCSAVDSASSSDSGKATRAESSTTRTS